MKSRLVTLVANVVLILCLLGCELAPTATPVPPRKITPPATATASKATSEPIAGPTSEPTPLPPQAPRLLARIPARGEELAIDAPLVLRFDQEMDQASVEAALEIAPQVGGELRWSEVDELHFTPDAPGFQRDAVYQVTVGVEAKSSQGLALEAPIQFGFRTVGYLQVTDVFPIPDSQDVNAQSAIRVIFNRPVVPLVGVGEQQELPQPLRLSPPVEGQGSWINTSIYSFEPRQPLAPGTLYTASISEGLDDLTGGILAEDYVWTFVTELPKVVSVWPSPGEPFSAPSTLLRLAFSQAMDKPSVESRFGLVPAQGGAAIAGALSWEEDTLVFQPRTALELGGEYVARLEAGALAQQGQAALAEETLWRFQVVSPPQIVALSILDGQTMVDLGEGLEITFSSPISREVFLESFEITPTVSIYPYWRRNMTQVQVSMYLKPSTVYTVTLDERILGLHGHPLQQGQRISFQTKPYAPTVAVRSPDRVATFNAYQTPTVYAQYRNVSRVNMALYAVPPEDFLQLNSADSWQLWDNYEPPRTNIVWRSSRLADEPLDVMGTISATLAQSDGASLAPGLYWLTASAPEAEHMDRRLLVVSPWNVTLKATQDSALLWVTDLRTGEPVADVDIAIHSASGRLVREIRTDKQGIAASSIPKQDPWEPLTILARKGDALSVVLKGWRSGISPWEFGFSMIQDEQDYRAHSYTERGIYRPEQTVYFKGILRSDDDGAYALPSQASVDVVAIDSQGKEFWSEKLSLSDMGTIHSSLELGEDAPLGYYHLQATYRTSSYQEYSFGTDFQVAEYRKPEFQVEVRTDRADYVHGETVQAVAEAHYFFGGAVANANVKWQVMRRPYAFDRWQGIGYASFMDYDYQLERPYISEYGEFVSEGQGKTDAQGRFTCSLPADISDETQSQVYTIEVSVTDLNNQMTSARASAIVHKGAYYIGLASSQYVGRVGKEMQIRAFTVDTQGDELPDQELEVVVSRHEWFSVREQADDGYYYWSNQVRDTPVVTHTVTTDDHGRAVIPFVPPEGGTFKAVARGSDEHQNQVRSALYLWVSGSRFVNWGQRNNDRIELISDKKTYAPGEVAQILVPSPYQGKVKALLTIERAGILEQRVIELEGNSEQLSISILPSYAPNVYLSLVLVKGMDKANDLPSLKIGYVMLPVSTEQQELTIQITPDREEHYQPRDTVDYDISVTDYRGAPVQAELSLQLVDLAVESLVGAQGNDIVQTFYRQRSLGVATAATLVTSVDRHNLEYAEEGKGGGGGGEGPMVREYFPDTAFWAPVVRTDASGAAHVSVDLPDSLTTWRLTAQGATAETLVGRATNDVVSTLDVLIRPLAPRFMVIGDEPILGAVVHNNTDDDLETTVSLRATGVQVQAPEQSVLIPAHSRHKLYWPASVAAVEQATLRYQVLAGEYGDAVELRLPVYHPSTPEIVGTAGQVQDHLLERVRLPAEADPTAGELTIQLEPSLAASMEQGLHYLRSYPYQCVEQTVSRFLPNVVTYRAMRQLDIDGSELYAALPQQVGVALQRLYSLQGLDGGWGWWRGLDSSPTLTAYVVLGMAEAREAGFVVDNLVLERAISFLNRWLDADANVSRRTLDQRATVLYALAVAGEGDLGRTVALYERRATMSLFAKGYLAMALHLLQPDESTRSDALANELLDAAILSSSGAHWEETQSTRWAMNTDLRTSAIVLRAMVQLDPDNALVANAVCWLVGARQSGRWETTQENVWAILALTDYMVATGELDADYAYWLRVNGVDAAQGQVSRETVAQAVTVKIPMADLQAGQDNLINIERDSARGKLYYSAFLRYFVPTERLQPLNRGIIVSRQYYLADDPETPIEAANVNDVLLVRLTLIAPHDLYFLVLEDPLPAGCEAIDSSLATSVSTGGPEFKQTDVEHIPERYRWYWSQYWPSHSEVRDEKIALFANSLRQGTYEYSYRVRCSLPGVYNVLPATAYEMYTPDVFGRSAGRQFEIAAAE